MTIKEIQSKVETANVEELKALGVEYKKILQGMQKLNDDYVHFIQEYISDIDDVIVTDPITLEENKRTLLWLTETFISIERRLEVERR